jgi:glutathione S-transferase
LYSVEQFPRCDLLTLALVQNTMAPALYMVWASPPVRAVLMTAKSLDLDLDLKEIDLIKGEHKTPQFLKINPQHTVPTLVADDGFVLWDSHAIMSYLVSKSSKDDSLYPKDLKKRALVDQRLHFDSGVAFALALKILRPIVYDGKKTVEQEEKDAIEEVYAFVETFLEGRRWIAGDSVTIADYSLISTITSLNVLSKVDAAKYSRVAAWLQRAETLPEYEANKKGLDLFAALMKSILG